MSTMNCPDCGRPISSRTKFQHCPHCGCPISEVYSAEKSRQKWARIKLFIILIIIALFIFFGKQSDKSKEKPSKIKSTSTQTVSREQTKKSSQPEVKLESSIPETTKESSKRYVEDIAEEVSEVEPLMEYPDLESEAKAASIKRINNSSVEVSLSGLNDSIKLLNK